ncbi:hypothetical protein CALVIDRAFT_167657 [Calocera viscosa TUFC12733]|uniref:Membrane-associated proteins in eicosanoid and glutathione metabolism n=1 Tax=Calocera viscosa (strain TUFC12733) TaxID=1330018 RepID=A0A167L5L5_CALVF|nr:hypothetical protein CALVIDRAFT_167657 [Calocera viscosa TUFC12733]
MSFLSHLTLDTPLALYSIPIAFFIGLAPHVHKIALLERSGVRVDNRSPRSATTTAEKKGLPTPLLRKVDRLASAHQNAHENFPVFVAAILGGLVAGMEARELNVFAGSYLALRVVYNFAYANQTTQAIAGVRSLAFWSATLWAMYVLLSAGNLMAKKGL